MDPVFRRAEIVEELALLFEGRLRRGVEAELEQSAGADALAQLAAYVGVGPADMLHLKVAVPVILAEHETPCRSARDRIVDPVEGKAIGA